MSQDNDLRIEIGIETDSSIPTAADELDDVADSLDAIESEMAQIKRNKALNDIARSAAKLSTETDDAKNATRELARELDKVGASGTEITKVTRSYNKLVDVEEKAIQKAKELRAQQDLLQTDAQTRFDDVSKKVSLGGDLGSAGGTFAGALQTVGADKAGTAVGAVSEIPEVLEAIPKFKESLKGLSSVASTAAESLGTNVATMGALGVAALALAAVWAIAKKQAEESRKAVEGAFEAQRERNSVLQESKRLTDEEQQARLESAQLRQEELQINADFAASVDEQLNQQNFLVKAIGETSAALGVGTQVYAVAGEQVETTAEALVSANAEVVAWESAIENNTNATIEATNAERDLAEARTEAVLSDAKNAADSLALEQDAADFSAEQLAARKKQIEEQRAREQTELDLLKASGDESEKVSARIDVLTSSIAGLGDDLTFLDSTQAKSAASANDAAKAQESLAKEEKKLAESATSAAASIESVANSFSTLAPSGTRRTRHTSGPRVSRARIGKRTSSAVREAASAIESEMTDAFRSAGEDRLNIIKEFNQRETELKRDAIFAQEQDLERFKFDQDQLLAKGSFTAAFQATVEKNFQQGQDRAQLQFDANTRQNDLTSQLAELSQALQQQTVQLQIEPSRQFDVRVVGGTANVINGIGSF